MCLKLRRVSNHFLSDSNLVKHFNCAMSDSSSDRCTSSSPLVSGGEDVGREGLYETLDTQNITEIFGQLMRVIFHTRFECVFASSSLFSSVVSRLVVSTRELSTKCMKICAQKY
jgi:hypothetical protein